MVLSYEYDTSYFGPPMPVIDVSVYRIGHSERTAELKALVDSGADTTMIPARMLKQIGARRVDTRTASGVSSVRYAVDIDEVGLAIGHYTLPKIYAVSDRQNSQMIVGRDVLNEFLVMLNGLANVVEISQ